MMNMDRAITFAAHLSSMTPNLQVGATAECAQLASIAVEWVEDNPPFDFVAEAMRTKSDKFYGELVPFEDLFNTLQELIEVCNRLDKIKKALFYGRQYEPQQVALFDSTTPPADCSKIGLGWHVGNQQTGVAVPFPQSSAIDLLHAVLGCVTESGEQAEALVRVLSGAVVDPVNFREETFDNQWYHAIYATIFGFTFEDGQRNIIAKLRTRFPEKFTTDGAINRDLKSERTTLENLQDDVNEASKAHGMQEGVRNVHMLFDRREPGA